MTQTVSLPAVKIVKAYFRSRYKPVARVGRDIISPAERRPVRPAEACAGMHPDLIEPLYGASDMPRYADGRPKGRPYTPILFRKWARPAWDALIAELPDADLKILTAIPPWSNGYLLLRAVRANPADHTAKLMFLEWAAENDFGRDLIAEVMGKEPELTDGGIGYCHPRGTFEQWRAILPAGLPAFAACWVWLACCQSRPTVYHGETSYGYKHRVERMCDNMGHGLYVPSGVFIAAAIAAGFVYRKVPGSSETLHGISKRSLPDCY